MSDEIKSSKPNMDQRSVIRRNGVYNTLKNFTLTLSLGLVATGASDLFLRQSKIPLGINILIIVFGIVTLAIACGINLLLEVTEDE